MSAGIDLLPNDEAQLGEVEERVLGLLYDTFDSTNEPVQGTELAYQLKGQISRVADLLQSNALSPYITRHNAQPEAAFTPTLRAAIRLRKHGDLQLAFDLYRECYGQFTPAHRKLDLQPGSRLYEALPRLNYLLDRDYFASIISPGAAGGIGWQVRINPSVLDAESLVSYLALRRGFEIRRPASQEPPARLRLEAISIVGVRSFANVTLNELGPLTVFAGPNEAGKSNLVRAIEFAARTATAGFASTGREWRTLRRLTSQTTESRIRLGLRSREPKQDGWIYEVSNEIGRDGSACEELVYKKSKEPLEMDAELRAEDRRLLASYGNGWLLDDNGVDENSKMDRGESLLSNLQDLNRFTSLIRVRAGLASWAFFHFEAGALRHTQQEADGRLRSDGSNLPAALLSLAERDEAAFRQVAESFAELLPEQPTLEAERGLSGGAILRLKERGLLEPLRHVDFSDGMLRILALLALAFDPDPPSLVIIEEPENGLYPRLIESMLDVLRQLANRTQVILTTHSITLLNRLKPEELVFMWRKDGATEIQRVDSRADVRSFLHRSGLGTQMLQGNLEDQP